MGRMNGDWGPRARAECGDLLEGLVKERPERFLVRLPALLGVVLELTDRTGSGFVPGLDVVGGESAFLRALQAEGDQIMRGSTVRKAVGCREGARGR